MQYTLRNVPEALDQALRERARQEGRSLNEVALHVLQQAMGLGAETPKRRDLSSFVGTLEPDPEMERAFEDQRRIDPEMWR